MAKNRKQKRNADDKVVEMTFEDMVAGIEQEFERSLHEASKEPPSRSEQIIESLNGQEPTLEEILEILSADEKERMDFLNELYRYHSEC